MREIGLKRLWLCVGFVVLGQLICPGTALGQTHNLPFRVIDAEFSAAMSRIIMISASPNRLHVYDPVTQTYQSVNLPKAPNNVSVGPDGYLAAVGHDGLISLINLPSVSIEKTLTVSINATDVILATNYVHQLPDFSVRISNGSITNTSTSYGTGGRLHPSGLAIYNTRDGLSPNDIEKRDISTGPITNKSDSPYHGDFPACGGIWYSPDGKRIYNGCGTVYNSSTDSKFEMTYAVRSFCS